MKHKKRTKKTKLQKTLMWVNIILFLADILYPNRCACCGKFIGYKYQICNDCEIAVDNLRTADDSNDFYTCYYYRREALEGIVANKDRNPNFGYHCGAMLALKMKDITADYIVSVPIWRGKKLRNHAENIAKVISKMQGVPLGNNILFKRKGAPEQHTLSAKDRSKYMDFFGIRDIDLTGKTVILVDDVITTGNTVKRCTELLKEKGAVRVVCACACATKNTKKGI